MKKSILLLLTVCFGLPALLHAGGPDKKTRITVGFYNVENLFDLENDPNTNDDEFMPEGSYGWTQEHFDQKIENLSKVISAMGDEDGPEILGLCEVENKAVLESLTAHKNLKKHGYQIVHHDSPDQRGIDCALIYKKKVFMPLYSKTYRVKFPENKDITTRDVLLVKGIVQKKQELTLIVNHWSSRRGGAQESEWKRERAASVVRHVVDSILEMDPYANIVIMGDFNDEPDNHSLMNVLRAGKDEVDARRKNKMLFNCMYKLKQEGQGTLKYKGEFDLFDQMIVSNAMLGEKALVKLVDCSAAIYNPKWMRVEKEGDWKDAPKRSHIRRKFHADGFSDHFPVYLWLDF